uniref:Homeodomain-like protein n=1 Tax=Rhizophagus irregularis (strain DAOM 181602 / DAOM 197198 / MUCL 43194) TaxID=747089 RepID=U9USM6_RHIID
MSQEFSEDLYWRIIYLHADGLSTVNIANTLRLSKGVINKIIRRYNRWACVKNPFKGIPGRRKLFSRADITLLRSLVGKKIDWYLDELVYEMECLTGKRASIATLWRSLQYLGITRKKLQKAALERNEIVRAYYLATISAPKKIRSDLGSADLIRVRSVRFSKF